MVSEPTPGGVLTRTLSTKREWTPGGVPVRMLGLEREWTLNGVPATTLGPEMGGGVECEFSHQLERGRSDSEDVEPQGRVDCKIPYPLGGKQICPWNMLFFLYHMFKRISTRFNQQVWSVLSEMRLCLRMIRIKCMSKTGRGHRTTGTEFHGELEHGHRLCLHVSANHRVLKASGLQADPAPISFRSVF